MRTADANDESGVEEKLRTVTPLTKEGSSIQMNLFGYLVVAPIILLMLPLLPFIAAGWIVTKGLKILRG